MDYTALRDTVLKLKERIIKTEAGDTQLSETDTRQGLINPLFRALQWDFTDFDSIRSELRVPQFNEPVDYAFFSLQKKSSKPILLLEAKRLGSTIDHKNDVKQLTSYLGATGVQWGVLSDGNRYVLYNSLGGASFEEQKFLTLEIKTIDTDSGFTMEEFLKHLTSLLSRECLENEDIQQAYEEHMINNRVRLALDSLLSTPFDTLCSAIRREFQEERVGLPEGIKISKKHIDARIWSRSPTTDSRTGQISLGDGGGHRLASWTSGYATARSEAICRGAGCGRTRTSGSVGGQGQQRPWSTRPCNGAAVAAEQGRAGLRLYAGPF